MCRQNLWTRYLNCGIRSSSDTIPARKVGRKTVWEMLGHHSLINLSPSQTVVLDAPYSPYVMLPLLGQALWNFRKRDGTTIMCRARTARIQVVPYTGK
jgi:hypothetical protein